MNKQRESVYTLRREILDGKIHLSEEELADTPRLRAWPRPKRFSTTRSISSPARTSTRDEWDLDALKRDLTQVFAPDRHRLRGDRARPTRAPKSCATCSGSASSAKYAEKEKIVPAELMRRVERDLMLQIVDAQWKDHLYSLDHLKEGIGLRGYGQRDPLVEYKKESFALFQDMRRRIEEEIVRYLWWLRPVVEGESGEAVPRRCVRRGPRRGERRRSPTTIPSAQRAPAFVGSGAAATAGGGFPGRGRRPAPQPGARRRRRRADQDGAPRRTEDRPQRPVLVRQRARSSRSATARRRRP